MNKKDVRRIISESVNFVINERAYEYTHRDKNCELYKVTMDQGRFDPKFHDSKLTAMVWTLLDQFNDDMDELIREAEQERNKLVKTYGYNTRNLLKIQYEKEIYEIIRQYIREFSKFPKSSAAFTRGIPQVKMNGRITLEKICGLEWGSLRGKVNW